MDSNNIAITHIFKKSLGKLLNNNEGIFVTIDDKIKPIFPGVDKVVVFNIDNNIQIVDYDGDLNDGNFVNIDVK